MRGEDPDALVSVLPEIAPVAALLLVDEAQFLTGDQVEDLLRIATIDGVPVLTYGLRTDFQTQIFPGSQRLLAIANTLEELKTICRCGKKAILNRTSSGRQIHLRWGSGVHRWGWRHLRITLCRVLPRRIR